MLEFLRIMLDVRTEDRDERGASAVEYGLLIAGIRPEHFEDAAIADQQGADSSFTATVEVVEWLGNETYAYIPFEAPPEVEKQLKQLEEDLDGESLRTQLVVTLDGSSRIAEGDEAEVDASIERQRRFDPDLWVIEVEDRQGRHLLDQPGLSD